MRIRHCAARATPTATPLGDSSGGLTLSLSVCLSPALGRSLVAGRWEALRCAGLGWCAGLVVRTAGLLGCWALPGLLGLLGCWGCCWAAAGLGCWAVGRLLASPPSPSSLPALPCLRCAAAALLTQPPRAAARAAAARPLSLYLRRPP